MAPLKSGPVNQAYVIDAVRTPVGKRNGSLAPASHRSWCRGVFVVCSTRNDVDPPRWTTSSSDASTQSDPSRKYRPQHVAGGRYPRKWVSPSTGSVVRASRRSPSAHRPSWPGRPN